MSDDKSGIKVGLRDSVSRQLALGKDLIALLRDAALFVLAFLLIAFPTSFNTLLTKAGFEEGSLVGFKWKNKLVDSDAALKEARATITDLKDQLAKTSGALAEVQSNSNDPALNEKIARIQEENKQLEAATTKVEQAVSNTIALSDEFVEKAQTGINPASGWGVVYGGDTKLKDAEYEIGIAPQKGIPNVSIYLRDGYYRSVSVSQNKSLAEQVLAKAKLRRSDAYIVDMSKWCPTVTEKTGYRECIKP